MIRRNFNIFPGRKTFLVPPLYIRFIYAVTKETASPAETLKTDYGRRRDDVMRFFAQPSPSCTRGIVTSAAHDAYTGGTRRFARISSL
jgi:hypothetical protein